VAIFRPSKDGDAMGSEQGRFGKKAKAAWAKEKESEELAEVSENYYVGQRIVERNNAIRIKQLRDLKKQLGV
jgi:hypothetical protein